MNIFFDMDYTLLGVNGGLRPGTHELMRRLKEEGHELYVWSGAGTRWSEVHALGLDRFVSGCFSKPVDNLPASLEGLDLPVKPGLVVDDHPELAALGGVWARPYLFTNGSDEEMERLYQLITKLAEQGL